MIADLAAAVLLSLLSSVAYALAAVVQERHAAAPRWWTIIGLNGGGALLHIGALAYASLAVVQPLGALTLVVALPIGATMTGRRVRGREWRGALLTVTGLVALLIAVGTAAPAGVLDDGQVVLVVVLSCLVIAGLAGRAYRAGTEPNRLAGALSAEPHSARSAEPISGAGPAGSAELLTATSSARLAGRRRLAGVRLAAAGGVAFAASSALTQTVLLRVGTDGPAALGQPAVAGTTLILVALSAAGLLLSQAAYRHGLGGPLATVTIVNPVAATGIGILLLGLGAGLTPPAMLAAVPAALLAAVGVVLLATPERTPARPACRPAIRRTRRRPRRRPVVQRNRRPASRTATLR